MKIALVHDDFNQRGGAERLFEAIAEIWKEALIYSSLVDFSKTTLNKERLRTSFIQKIPFAKKLYKTLLPLYPFAFENFNFDNYDVVLSSTTRFAKAIITKPKTIHICYINSTPRFLWDDDSQKEYMPRVLQVLIKPIFFWLRKWDLVASARPDYLIANSQNVANSIKQIYRRESKVIYPFVDTDFFVPAKENPQDYFLIITRLVKWKKVDIAIEAAKSLGLKLIIVGVGPDKKRLVKLARDNAEIFFAGAVTNHQLRLYLQFAKALIVTQKEDFGISTVEAQACGRPVIAYAKGGQAEIISNGETGILYKNQTTQSLKDAIEEASEVKWNINLCRKAALRFTKSIFEKRLKEKVEEYAPKSQ